MQTATNDEVIDLKPFIRDKWVHLDLFDHLSPGAVKILCPLLSKGNTVGTHEWFGASIKWMSKRTNAKLSSQIRYFNELIHKGFIETRREGSPARRQVRICWSRLQEIGIGKPPVA